MVPKGSWLSSSVLTRAGPKPMEHESKKANNQPFYVTRFVTRSSRIYFCVK
ncbi:hypothetical protein HanRHA438_Chr08g0368761 [Helianthus annuus]|uniref:Uncharacterized protein n=1 Tax=Helianthus annuus TaxID=4232 RepID=A0A251U8K0_HELAN|nr:hypothetical protein HanXRQr2_Chr08g0356671 [Helianthus annuus]KAJ0548536.1 hypothetical protein HanIR_Chr08g0384911 [Helianthus annuus]KAJ0899453.1 hypothetical protein HanRHA438_Chr08g0368761 [Helianthus annuus]KAJ0903032.1 hypothetical protein HanPSC8_Chr08g0344351 [Helianthus annuus]